MPKRTNQRLTKRRIDDAQPGQWVWDNEVRGFALRVSNGATKSFVFQYRTRAGTQGRVTIGRFPSMTVDEARQRAKRLQSEVYDGGHPSERRRADFSAPSVHDLIEFYLIEYAQARRLKHQTIADAKHLLYRFVAPGYGARKVESIRVADIRKVHGDAHEKAGKYQANRLLAALSKMFNLAIENEWRVDNPCRGVKKYPEEQRWTKLSHAQVARLLAVCDCFPDRSAANALKLLLFTGARLQEVVKAQWRDFDLETGLWVKSADMTKTQIRHEVCLAEATITVLREMKMSDPDRRYLFPGIDPIRPRTDLKRPWMRIREQAELQNFRLHDLRRTFASFMLSSGSGLAAVGKALGHKQVATTARYAHLHENVQRAGVNQAVQLMTVDL